VTGKEVKAARTRLNMNQQAFAAALGVNQGTISRWEQGKIPVPEIAARLIGRLAAERKKRTTKR
jgi:DNA-binding transcriptional regulator YiaG